VARSEIRRPELANGILIFGALAHVVLCVPAIGCRGYPPLAPIWYGVTYLWPVAILVSGYFDSIRFETRRKQLIIYALVTAFFSAGTIVLIVPRDMGPGLMLYGSIIFGPLHLMVTFVLEFAIQVFYSIGRNLVDRNENTQRFKFSAFSLLSLFGWIILILGIPLGYKSFVEFSENNFAIECADSHWKTKAYIYLDSQFDQIGDCSIHYGFDPETGLECKPRRADLGFADRYNERINELIERDGIPQYSIKAIIPETAKLIKMLDSNTMDLVENFPIDLTENIHLMRRGSSSRSGATNKSSDDYLSIVTPHISMSVDNCLLPVHTIKDGEIIYICSGSDWIGAFLSDGRMVISVSRFP
tara:strand:+ start:396 stop:1469 length:1074 start_codon:yes stop_codon:yes gene_type:complete